MKDNNGREIKIGDMVAYSRSGDVVKGVVEKFQGNRAAPRQWWYRTIYVRNSKDNKLSKVKRPQSLMVIAEQITTNQTGEPYWSLVWYS